MKKRFVLVLLFIILPVFVYAASIISTYSETVTKANNYIISFRDRKKYLIFNKKYIYEDGVLSGSASFTNGGLLSKSEFELSVFLEQSYLATGKEYWTLTSNGSNKYYVDAYLDTKSQTSKSGTRVTEYIKPGTIVEGKGTYSNPWTFMEGYAVDVISNNTNYGTVSPLGAQYVKPGSSVDYVLTPSNGYFYNSNKDNCNLIKKGANVYENNYVMENINKDITCTAVFDQKTYKFELRIESSDLDYNNSQKTYSTNPSPSPIYYKYRTHWYSDAGTRNVINKITKPAMTGWTFEGYYYGNVKVIDENGDIKVTDLNLGSTNDFVDTNHVLYAKFTKNPYTISYNLDGGTFGAKHPTSANYDEVVEIDYPTKAGYSFEGWSHNGNSNTAVYGVVKPIGTDWSEFGSSANIAKKVTKFANLNPTKSSTVTMTAHWQKCPIGTFNDGSKSECTTCPAGTYSDSQGNTSCKPCDAGYYCGGGSEKKPCPAGTFRSSTGGKTANDCTKCVVGSITSTTGQTKCTACQPSGQVGTGGTTTATGQESCNKSCEKAHVSTWTATVWNTNNTIATNTLCHIATCVAGYTLGSNTCTVNEYTISYAGMDGASYGTNHPTSATYDSDFTVNNPSKVGYTFTGWKITGMDSVTHYYGSNTTTNTSISSTKATTFKNLTSVKNATVTFTAQWSINQYTLTIKPNGGTWGGSTSDSTITQDYNSTYTVAAPSAGPTYTISYNANSQGTTYTASPKSVQRPFSSWSKTGSGSLSGTTYTFGAGNGTLTANYSNTSNSFTLPSISKQGYSCKWAEGSTSGTQYIGGSSRTITANTTYYASCSANTYTISYAGMDGASYGTNHPTSATYDTAFTVNNPSKTGYKFTGWKITGMDSVTHYYGSNTTTATSISSTKETSFKNLKSTSGTVTFTAQWQQNNYTVNPSCSLAVSEDESTVVMTVNNASEYGMTYVVATKKTPSTPTATYNSNTSISTSFFQYYNNSNQFGTVYYGFVSNNKGTATCKLRVSYAIAFYDCIASTTGSGNVEKCNGTGSSGYSCPSGYSGPCVSGACHSYEEDFGVYSSTYCKDHANYNWQNNPNGFRYRCFKGDSSNRRFEFGKKYNGSDSSADYRLCFQTS